MTEDLPLLEDDEPLVITQESFAVAVQEVKPDDFAITGQIILINLGNNTFGSQGLGNNTLLILVAMVARHLPLPLWHCQTIYLVFLLIKIIV